MMDLVEAWKAAWLGYGFSNNYLIVAAIVSAVCAYRNWQKTFLVLWLLVYGWTMTVLLAGQYIDINAGMTVLWVCGYGLFGFLFFGFLIYTNLKS